MASKKSSIPRAAHDCDRNDGVKSKLRGPKPPVKPNQSHIHSKPPVNDGLRPEDEDAVRRSLLELEADHAKMKQTLEETVREAEERLETMRKLMAERERLNAERFGAESERNEQLEQQIGEYEKALIENNIDPVTGEIVEPTEEQSANVEKIKKVSKKDVSRMREKLQELNENSDKNLIAVQAIMRDIEEIEATSSRAGGPPPSTVPMSNNEMMDLIKEVEEAQKKEEKERKKKKKEAGEEVEEEEEEEEEEGGEEEKEGEKEEKPTPPVQDKKDSSRPTSKSDVFITQK